MDVDRHVGRVVHGRRRGDAGVAGGALVDPAPGGLVVPVRLRGQAGAGRPDPVLALRARLALAGRPLALGVAAALGAAIKMQPGLLLVWAVLTGRLRAVWSERSCSSCSRSIATVLAGAGAWADFLALLRTVSDPITTEHNLTPGAVAFQLGVAGELRRPIQLVSTVAVVVSSSPPSGWRRRSVVHGRRSSRASSSRRSCGTTTRCSCCCRSRTCCPPAAGGRSRSRSRRRGLWSGSHRRRSIRSLLGHAGRDVPRRPRGQGPAHEPG